MKIKSELQNTSYSWLVNQIFAEPMLNMFNQTLSHQRTNDFTMANKTNELNRKNILIFFENENLNTNLTFNGLLTDYNLLFISDVCKVLNCIDLKQPVLIVIYVKTDFDNCFNLCRNVKNDIRYSHIPVVVISDTATTGQQIKCFENGADDFIQLIDSQLIELRIRHILKRSEQMRQQLNSSDVLTNIPIKLNQLDVIFMQKIKECIEKNFTKPGFNVNDIIRHIGMSRSAFYNKFKMLSNISIHELINNYRLKKAEQLLQNSDLNINEVANECGYEDPAYFCRVFKRKYHISPKKFKSIHSRKID